MLIKILNKLGLSIYLAVLVSCTKQVEDRTLSSSVEAQYLIADQQIGTMLDDLENRNVSLSKKSEILCKKFPDVYKMQYMPALLKLSPEFYTEEILLRDYEAVISFYKKAFVVNCG